MIKMVENTVTSKVTELLSGMTHGWKFASQQKPFVGNTLQTDIIAMRDGRETVAIEAKSHDVNIEAGVEQLRTKYFGKRLKPAFQRVSATLETGLVIRYPEKVQNVSDADLEHALKHTNEIEYCVIMADDVGNFPQSGYAKGSLRDIATALHIGASPTKKIREVAEVYSAGMDEWSADIERSIKNRPAIGDMLAEILGQDADVETCKTACMFIIDAFIFQNAVAGKECFREVRRLEHYEDDAQINYKGIIRDWLRILKMNYVPIFKDAAAIVKILREYDEDMARRVLKGLLNTAIDISKSHLQQVHEIGGELFQDLVVDRDNVKAHYTRPESATLLSSLVCPDIDVDNLPKVADYACGTGALLNGVYKRIQQLYERKTGKSSQEIHREMVENNLAASDIYPHATHLTFTAMAACHPTTTLGQTRVITAPYGKREGIGFLTGSLELLDTQQLKLRTLGTMAEQIIGDADIATVDYKREFPDGEMDIVIINPPFSKSADRNSGKGKAAFKAKNRSEEERKLMEAELKKKPMRISNGNNGLGSCFVDMADRKLKAGGTMGFILLSTTLVGTGMKKLRKMLAEEYHDVIVVTIAQNSGYDSAFSHDTGMRECMIVATKGIGANTGRATFVCLTERPDGLLTAQTLANQIRRNSVTRRMEDLPHGGDELRIGKHLAGQVLDAPIDENEWAASNIRAFSLIQMGYHLRNGNLQLPRQLDGIELSMCQIRDIAEINVNEADIKNETHERGAFYVREGAPTSHETYPTLWKVKSTTQRAMQTAVNAHAWIQPSKEQKARDILGRNSRTHYHRLLVFNANSQIASFTEDPSIGASTLGNVCLHESQHEAAWTLWTNSTFGMMCHWLHAGKQNPGRGKLTWSQRGTIATLDVRQLTDEQLAKADEIFAELKDARMLPYNESVRDKWRHVLDARLLAEVLGITDESTHREMQRLREMLCEEPTIAGTKKETCDLEAEREKYNLGGSPETDAKALATQQLKLKMAGIWLPS